MNQSPKVASISFKLLARKGGVYIRNFKLNGIQYRFDYRYSSVTEAMAAIHEFVDFLDKRSVT